MLDKKHRVWYSNRAAIEWTNCNTLSKICNRSTASNRISEEEKKSITVTLKNIDLVGGTVTKWLACVTSYHGPLVDPPLGQSRFFFVWTACSFSVCMFNTYAPVSSQPASEVNW